MLDIAKFNATPLNASPYPYLVVKDFLHADCLEAVTRDFPEIKQAGSFPIESLKCGATLVSLLHELEGAEFRQAVEQKFGLDLSNRPTMMTLRGRTDETDGRIHTDSKTKIITVLLYFNQGWQQSGGRLRVLRSGTDLEDYAEEVEPSIGTLLVFKRSDNSWHGHHPFIGERRTLQLNWVLNEKVKQREQARHGFSAFFKKLFGIKQQYAG